jgi:hypothetical protein
MDPKVIESAGNAPSEGSPKGNREREACTERTVIEESQVATQSAGEAAAQGESQTDSGRRLRGVVSGLGKRPKELSNDLVGQAGSVVAHGQRQPSPRRCQLQVDAAIGRTACVLDCIIHQVRQDLIDHGEIHAYIRGNIGWTDDEFHAALSGTGGQAGDQSIEQIGGCNNLAAVGGAAALKPGESQDVLDEVTEPVGLGA